MKLINIINHITSFNPYQKLLVYLRFTILKLEEQQQQKNILGIIFNTDLFKWEDLQKYTESIYIFDLIRYSKSVISGKFHKTKKKKESLLFVIKMYVSNICNLKDIIHKKNSLILCIIFYNIFWY